MWFVLGLFLTAPVPAVAQDGLAPLTADVILKNGNIWTVAKQHPEAVALAIRGDRILAIGSDAQVLKLAGPKTHIIDLQKRRVVPGFHDSHLHLLSSGLQLSRVTLKDAKDEAEFGKRLREFAAKLPPGRWLQGNDWDHDRTFGGKLPTAAMLDKYVSDRPVFLRRYDGHMGLANTKALTLAGISATTKDPNGGVIYRDPATKQPTGLLRDNAMSLVSHLIPPPAEDEVRRCCGRSVGNSPPRHHQRPGHGRQRHCHSPDVVSRLSAAAQIRGPDLSGAAALAAGGVAGRWRTWACSWASAICGWK